MTARLRKIVLYYDASYNAVPGADSKGTARKSAPIPSSTRHNRPGAKVPFCPVLFCSGYNFITSFLHKINDENYWYQPIRKVFATKSSPKCSCGPGSEPLPGWESLPRLLVGSGFGKEIPSRSCPSSTPSASQFPGLWWVATRLSAAGHVGQVLIIKSRRLFLTRTLYTDELMQLQQQCNDIWRTTVIDAQLMQRTDKLIAE